MDYKLISGDSHIDMTWMPGNVFLENAPAQYRDSVPRVVETDTGPHWIAEGKDLGVYGGLGFGFTKPNRGQSKHIDMMYDAGFYEGGPHPSTPELRLKDMEIDGIEAEVIYGILGVGLRFEDPRMTSVVYEIYNSWAADFCNARPGKWAALACIPNHDPNAAAAELRRAANSGPQGRGLRRCHCREADLAPGLGPPLAGRFRMRHPHLIPHHRTQRARAQRSGDGAGIRP